MSVRLYLFVFSTVLYSNDDTVAAAMRTEARDGEEENFLLLLKNRLKALFTGMCDESGTTKTFRETRLAAPLAQALCCKTIFTFVETAIQMRFVSSRYSSPSKRE